MSMASSASSAAKAAAAAAASSSSSGASSSNDISTELLVSLARQAGEHVGSVDKGMVGGMFDKVTSYVSGVPDFKVYMKAIGEFFDFLETIHISHKPLLTNLNNREAVVVNYYEEMKICQKTQNALLRQIQNGKRTEKEVFEIYVKVFETIYNKNRDNIIEGFYKEQPDQSIRTRTEADLTKTDPGAVRRLKDQGDLEDLDDQDLDDDEEIIYNDEWMVDGAVKFMMSDDRKFSISCFYNTALRLQEIAEDQLADASDEERADSSELIFPDILMLNLYRLIDMSLGANPERLMIKTQIGKIEKNLGLSDGENIIVSEKTVEKFRSIFETMIKSYNGGKMPDQMKTPDARVITQALNKTIGNSELQKQAKKIIGQVTSINANTEGGVGAYFDAVLQGLSDPNLKSAILSTLETVTNTVSELNTENKKNK